MSQPKIKIGIVNLMPTKEATHEQLTTLLTGYPNNDVDISLSFLYPKSHYQHKKVPDFLSTHYQTIDELDYEHLDGIIITGAPVEQFAFEEVDYWEELSRLFDLLEEKKIPQLYICWSAQAALYHKYGIQKQALAGKCLGVFEHLIESPGHPLLANHDNTFYAPHSRYTELDEVAVRSHPELEVLASSEAAGLYLLSNRLRTETYVFGHAEYAVGTLDLEYQRDAEILPNAPFPRNYYDHDDVNLPPLHLWKSHGQQLFSNWLDGIEVSTRELVE